MVFVDSLIADTRVFSIRVTVADESRHPVHEQQLYSGR
jgi:hypothetical protein